MSEEKLPKVEIPLSYLTKEELIKILLELKEQNEAMNKRLNNQCDLLERQRLLLDAIKRYADPLCVTCLPEFMRIDFKEFKVPNYRLSKIASLLGIENT